LRKAQTVTEVTETIAVRKYSVQRRVNLIQEGIMSLLSHTHERTDLQHRDFSFILAVVCMALAVVVASAIFTPAPVGAGITSEITVPPSL
jgi:hypothetical protein